MGDASTATFVRDRTTWVMYAVLGWFAYLQAAPGLVVPHLREELHLGYAIGGLHVSAFALGSTVTGLAAARLEEALGRARLLMGAMATMALAAIGLTAGQHVAITLGSTLVLGLGGGGVLATVQAVLADHHGRLRSVALAEANVAASVGYLLLVGALALAASGAGWRAALLACLVVPLLLAPSTRRLPLPARVGEPVARDPLPGRFWVAGGVLVCVTGVEWCATAWGASFTRDAVHVSTDGATLLMGAYFAGFLAGRVTGSRLARSVDPARLLGLGLLVTAAGFAVLWPAHTAAQAAVGLAVLGAGIGNLFPMGLSVAVALAPDRAGLASARAVALTSAAALVAPFAVGTLADATSLTAALAVIPALLALAGLGLLAIVRLSATRDEPSGGRPRQRQL